MKKQKYTYNELLEVVDKLRAEGGCPWDRAQTHETFKKYLIEEAYETLEAIEKKDDNKIIEELGDVLLQVVFHAQIGKEEERFTMDDVIDGISNKMISRHTHVFGEDIANTPEEVLVTWNKNKNKEKGFKTGSSIIKDIPKNFPGLLRASELQKKVAKMDLNWEEKIAIDTKYDDKNEEKEMMMGQKLFDLVKECKDNGVEPETSLQRYINKYIGCFEKMEEENEN